jgi:HPt (histidine-containing phosphotransfer) domain-containing protein
MVERLGGDEELVRQLITLFLGEYPKLMENLRLSVSGGQPDAIRRAAHAAKGCIANFVEGGGPQATAFRIEQLGTAGALSEVPGLVARLERELDALARDMIAFQESTCES